MKLVKLTRLKLFLFFSLFGIIVLSINYAMNYHFITKEIKTEFTKEANHVINARLQNFSAMMKHAESALTSLSTNRFLYSYLEDRSSSHYDDLQNLFAVTAALDASIMQLRYIDESGKEHLRIERQSFADSISISSKASLQNKTDRYYFKQCMTLTPEKVYYSDFDLNIENGKIEQPLKPTIRIARRVYKENKASGIIILNLFLGPFIDSLKNIDILEIFLVDSAGNFVTHPDGNKSWSKYFNPQLSFFNEFPQFAGTLLDQNSSSKKMFLIHDLYKGSNESYRLVAKMKPTVLQKAHEENLYQMVMQILVMTFVGMFLSVLFGNYLLKLYNHLFLHVESFNALADAIFIYDASGSIVYANKTAWTRLGYTQKEMYELTMNELSAYYDVIPEGGLPVSENTIKEKEFLTDFTAKDGRRMPFDVRSKRIEQDSKTLFICVARDISKEIQKDDELKHSEAKYRLLVNTSAAGIFQADLDGAIIFANPAMRKILGCGSNERCFGNILDFYKNRQDRNKLLRVLIQKESIENYEVEIINKEGEAYTLLANISFYEDSFFGMFIDITEIKKAEEEIRVLSQIVEQIDDSVVLTDVNGIIEYVNKAFIKHTGFDKNEIYGKTSRLLKSGKHPDLFYSTLWDTILSGEVFRATFTNKKKNGEIYFEEKTITPLKDKKGNITAFVSTAKDISERIEMEAQLQSLAETDHLTKIFNRVKFDKELEESIRRFERYRHPFCVVMLDIDHFKSVNDTYGHAVGDALLQELAGLLDDRMRSTDIVARWGGEEFVIVLSETSLEDAKYICESIRKEVAAYEFSDNQRFTVSLGLSMMHDGDTAKSIIKRADDALYKAKEHGRNKVVIEDIQPMM